MGPKRPFGGPKTDQILIFGPKKVCTGPLRNYRRPNWCYSIISNYPTIKRTLLDPNMCHLGPKWPFGGPKTYQILFFGPKKLSTGPLSNYRGPNWCKMISTNYPTMSGTHLDPHTCLLGPKRPFLGPKTDQILNFWPTKVNMGPLCNYRGPNCFFLLYQY